MPKKKSEQELKLDLARTIQKLVARILSGNENERRNTNELLDALLRKHRLTANDVPELIALAVANPERSKGASSQTTTGGASGGTATASSFDSTINAFDVVDFIIRKFLCLEDHQRIALALWILHTHVFTAFSHTPRLGVLSPVRN